MKRAVETARKLEQTLENIEIALTVNLGSPERRGSAAMPRDFLRRKRTRIEIEVSRNRQIGLMNKIIRKREGNGGPLKGGATPNSGTGSGSARELRDGTTNAYTMTYSMLYLSPGEENFLDSEQKNSGCQFGC